MLAGFIRAARCAAPRRARGRAATGRDAMLDAHPERPPVNWWILGGGLAFAVVSLGVGLGEASAGQEIIFAAPSRSSLFLMRRLVARARAGGARTRWSAPRS